MNLSDMRTIVRRDLHDEDSQNYRWSDSELERHIAHAVKDFSQELPLEDKAVKATTQGSREIDISSLNQRVMVAAVEYPAGRFPPLYQRFSIWGDVIALLGAEVPDGSNANIYYGKLHTLDGVSSTLPPQHEDLVAAGACGYAAVEWAIYAINRVNVGGGQTARELLSWGREKLAYFQGAVEKLGRTHRLRAGTLYRPYHPTQSQTRDYGP